MTCDGSVASAFPNSSRSIREAAFENTLKFTPPSLAVAPGGHWRPAARSRARSQSRDGWLLLGASWMMGQSAFAAGNPRLFAGPLMRNALGVRGFAAPAGDLLQSGSIEQC